MEQNRQPSHPTLRKKRRGSKHPAVLVLQWLLLFGAMGVMLAGGVVIGYVAALVKDEPVRSYDEYKEKIFSNYQTGFAYYEDGTLIGQLRAEEDRRIVKEQDVSPFLIDAIIATEDKYFYEHHGVVLQSTLRGAFQDFTDQDVVTGGSTLTQQLIKNTILSPEVSHKRKVKEIFNALRLERMFTKSQILEAYLNEIYLGKNANGSNIYGVQAAARGIFDKDAKDLTLAEASYIAGMIQTPGKYSPFKEEGYQRGKERQKTVLDRMLEVGKITQAQYVEAWKTDLRPLLAKPAKRAYAEHPHLMMEIEERAAEVLVQEQLKRTGQTPEDLDSELYESMVEEKRREILRNGYHIHTTINKKANDIMQAIASDPDNFDRNETYTVRVGGKLVKIENALEEIGAVMIDNKSGAILGMIGGRDFNVEQTNHATVPRQPGSAMKPLAAFAPAFELGILQPGSPIDDSPMLLPDGQTGVHIPFNWDNRYHGIISAREALRKSWNIPAIKTYLKVTIPKALDYVKKMGVTTLTESDNHAATGVIGGLAYGLTVEEITNAYATFANRGSFVDAYLINRIEDSSGNVIYRHHNQPVPVFSEQTAYLITDVLRTVVNEGTAAGLRNYVPKSIDVAGKTGTTNDNHDLWFVGYTPDVSLGIWIGYDVPHVLPKSASSRPVKIWGTIMRTLFDQAPEVASSTNRFQQPPGIVTFTVDSKSGLLPSSLSREAGHLIQDLFNTQMLPQSVDNLHEKARVIEVNGKLYLAKETTPDDFVQTRVLFRSPEPVSVTPQQILEKNPRANPWPADWNQRIPAEKDPREDNGQKPIAPRNVSVSVNGTAVTLKWLSGNEPDLVGYRIYRAEEDGSFVKIKTIAHAKTYTYVDQTDGQKNYQYYVTAVDVAGQESEPSTAMSASFGEETPLPGELPEENEETQQDPDVTPLPNPGNQPPKPSMPGVPSSPKGGVAKLDKNGVVLTWKANPASEAVLTYNIYYKSDPNGTVNLLDTVSTPTYLHRNGSGKGTYYITAVNSYGESERSIEIRPSP